MWWMTTSWKSNEEVTGGEMKHRLSKAGPIKMRPNATADRSWGVDNELWENTKVLRWEAPSVIRSLRRN